MGDLLTFPPQDVDRLWTRYQRLASALADDVALAADRTHMREMARAEAAWKQAYLAQVRP